MTKPAKPKTLIRLGFLQSLIRVFTIHLKKKKSSNTPKQQYKKNSKKTNKQQQQTKNAMC